jgi:two-component system NtrC family sensor kinase
MARSKIKKRFSTGTAGILIVACAAASVLTYYYLKARAIDGIYRETEIYIGMAEATRTYVKEALRPVVRELVPADDFIPQAMSTSYVGREIMGRVKKRFPDFIYKRPAVNPINPINQADAFEARMLAWFNANPRVNEWQGLIERHQHAYFARFKAIYAEQECLLCHGDPADAPRVLKDLYGTDGGFHYTVGEAVAADAIYIPVDVALIRVKEAAWSVFLIGGGCLFLLMVLFYLLFNRTVVSELKGLLSTFGSIGDAAMQAPERFRIESGDEIDQLKTAFENVAQDLKQAHDAVKASESKYRLLYETSQDAIVLFDARGAVIQVNPAGGKLFGLTREGRDQDLDSLTSLLQADSIAREFWHTLERQGYVRGMELALTDLSGRSLEVMVSATVRRGDGGAVSGIDAMFRDVTEKRRIEKYLAQAEKLASIGQLASGVAHEINNPLGVIQCYADLIARARQDDVQLQSDVDIIRKHTDQCKNVVKALLNFARAAEPQRTRVNITDCIEDVLSVLQLQIEKDEVAIRRRYDPHLPMIDIDPDQMRQVFMNLLINAHQAIAKPGTIFIATSRAADDRIEVTVRDTGSGIPKSNLEKIFDPFFTTKESDQGTGLGLSVSYGIVKQHDGEILVESTAGQGTTFTVILPIHAEKESFHG